MNSKSLLSTGHYSPEWVQAFYIQAAKWWGPEVNGLEAGRVTTLERLCGPGPKRILELGAGAGLTAALMADQGHQVVAVEFSPVYADYARAHLKTPRSGQLEIIEADFYTVELNGQFDVVCYWDGFGVSSDAEHRRLLHRIADQWLTPAGCVLMDVFSPFRPIRDAGTEIQLDPLADVPDSVAMLRRCRFDPLFSRWIDEWQPVAAPENAQAQTLRCYTPADFILLLDGTGLTLQRLEVEEQAIDWTADTVITAGPLTGAWTYLVQLAHDQARK
ncbi:MAG TPA: class I SAM-dependent methyltransferase [Phototrophicaceae bacterium]|nr:class I SAM-dependent methyltransferase [Phototrophicaceae bacterium]